MRRTASEVLRELQIRVARLERLGSTSSLLAQRLFKITKEFRQDSFMLDEIEKALESSIEEIFEMGLEDLRDFQVLGVVRESKSSFYVKLKLKPTRGRAITKSLLIEDWGGAVVISESRMPRGQSKPDWLDGLAKAQGNNRND